MSFFDNKVAQRCAHILAAQCKDLLMTDIAPFPNGDVEARLKGRTYRFRWNIMNQRVDLVQVQTMELAA